MTLWCLQSNQLSDGNDGTGTAMIQPPEPDFGCDDLLLTPLERERYAVQLREFEERMLPGLEVKLKGMSADDEDAYDDILDAESFVEGAIGQLRQALRRAGSISTPEATKADYVRLGSRVLARHGDGSERIYVIGLTLYDLPPPTREVTGTDWGAPVAAALRGKRADEEAVVDAPCGTYVLQVLSVQQPIL